MVVARAVWTHHACFKQMEAYRRYVPVKSGCDGVGWADDVETSFQQAMAIQFAVYLARSYAGSH